MFWGLRLEPGKRYSTTVDRSFHISMAALDCSSVKSDNEVLSVMLDEGETNVSFILCNLQKNKLMQSPLDLNFMTGDRITIYCKGNGVVHLSGYIAEEDDELEQLGEEDDDEVEDEADELSENEEMQITKGKGKLNGLQEKRKVDELKSPQPKRKKLEKMDEDTEDSDDEDDDMASDNVEDESMDLEGEESDEDDDDDDDDDDEEEEEEDEDESDLESDEENKMPSKPQQQVKKNKKNKPQGQQQQVSNKQQNTPNLNKQQNTPNLNKQQQNKGKQQPQQKTPNGLSPEAQMKKDKKKGDKSPGNTPNSNVKLNKSTDDSSPNAKRGGEPQAKKTLDGGVIVKDLKVGNGPACKAGKIACVYYTGRFKQNNKVFDSTSEGPGFKFRVGKGDVIKGWDVGVIGMKVGGKRLITCPPQMAYGLKGSPPTIPANSTLVFEVELKSVN